MLLVACEPLETVCPTASFMMLQKLVSSKRSVRNTCLKKRERERPKKKKRRRKKHLLRRFADIFTLKPIKV